MPARSRASSTGRFLGEEARRQLDRFAHGQVFEQPARLENGRDEAAGDGSASAVAEHLDAAGVGVRQAQNHVDRGGLARAVRAEEGHDLARSDGEVDAADGVDGAEALDDAPRVDRGGGGVEEVMCSCWPRGPRAHQPAVTIQG